MFQSIPTPPKASPAVAAAVYALLSFCAAVYAVVRQAEAVTPSWSTAVSEAGFMLAQALVWFRASRNAAAAAASDASKPGGGSSSVLLVLAASALVGLAAGGGCAAQPRIVEAEHSVSVDVQADPCRVTVMADDTLAARVTAPVPCTVRDLRGGE